MFWNVASAQYEISLRKWSGGTVKLRASRRHEGDLVGLVPPNKAPKPPKLKSETL